MENILKQTHPKINIDEIVSTMIPNILQMMSRKTNSKETIQAEALRRIKKNLLKRLESSIDSLDTSISKNEKIHNRNQAIIASLRTGGQILADKINEIENLEKKISRHIIK
tara:strand:- start:569 stop:901 length:333 start_codon:yes stop_codon:yes gene_type:complete